MKKAISILLFFGLFAWFLPAKAEELSYSKVLKKYHRHGEKYSWDTLHENIFWDVIYQSMEFREAYERQYGKYYKLTPAEIATRIEEERQDAEAGDEFLVILNTYSKVWNDLDSKDSIWRLRLLVGNDSIAPESIKKIKPTPIDATFYPFILPWEKVYRVVFPRGSVPAENSDFRLSLYGVKGQETLTWNLSK
jgi:hypothetical protein